MIIVIMLNCFHVIIIIIAMWQMFLFVQFWVFRAKQNSTPLWWLMYIVFIFKRRIYILTKWSFLAIWHRLDTDENEFTVLEISEITTKH